VTARDDDRDKRPQSDGPNHGGRLPPSHRVRTDTDRWGFSLRRWLPGMASCLEADHRLYVGVGHYLLWHGGDVGATA
jgi:hypothetical protein